MYNGYTNGSEAWYAMRDAEQVVDDLKSAQNEIESVFERIIDELDTAIGDRDDFEDDLSRLQTEHDELKQKYDSLHATRQDLIPVLTDLMVGAARVEAFAKAGLVALGALNETTDPDNSDRDSGDGGSEGDANASPGSSTSEGVSRPQVP